MGGINVIKIFLISMIFTSRISDKQVSLITPKKLLSGFIPCMIKAILKKKMRNSSNVKTVATTFQIDTWKERVTFVVTRKPEGMSVPIAELGLIR
jgi:hypothetical protein